MSLMNHKAMQVIVIVGLAGALAACSTTYNRNRMIGRVVTAHKLKNGDTLKVGYKEPQSAWQCKKVGQATHNWALQQFEGMAKFAGGYQKLRDEAIAYANKHKNVNYAYLYIPNQTSVMGVNVTVMRKAHIYYYDCKYPPAVHHNPFKSK